MVEQGFERLGNDNNIFTDVSPLMLGEFMPHLALALIIEL